MNEPLKELLFEKVENSHTLKTDIFYAIVESFDALDPEKDSPSVSAATSCVLQIITDFINQNYTPKTDLI